MEVVKSVRVNLSINEIDDIQEYAINYTPQQIIDKFRIFLDRKEIEINDRIEENNAEHLLVLQKKMLVLEKKDDQIVKLNNTLSRYKNEMLEDKSKLNDMAIELLDTKMKAIHFEKKMGDFEGVLKEEKGKRERLKKEHNELQNEYNKVTKEADLERDRSRRLKVEKDQWNKKTELVLSDLQKSHAEELCSELKSLKESYETKIANLINEEKKKCDIYKEKYTENKKTIQNLTKTNHFLSSKLQTEKELVKSLLKEKIDEAEATTKMEVELTEEGTDEINELGQNISFTSNLSDELIYRKRNSSFIYQKENRVEKEVQTDIFDCESCKRLKESNFSLELQKETASLKLRKPTVVDCNPKVFSVGIQLSSNGTENRETQTVYDPLTQSEELKLQEAFQSIKISSLSQISLWKKRYFEMESLFVSRPSNNEDLRFIEELENKIKIGEEEVRKKEGIIEDFQKLVSEMKIQMESQRQWYDQFDMGIVEVKNANKSFVKEEIFDSSPIFSDTSATFKVSSKSKDKRSITINIREFGRRDRRLSSHSLDKGHTTALERLMKDIHTEPKQGDGENSSRKVGKESGVTLKNNKIVPDQISEMRKYKKYKGSLKIVKV